MEGEPSPGLAGWPTLQSDRRNSPKRAHLDIATGSESEVGRDPTHNQHGDGGSVKMQLTKAQPANIIYWPLDFFLFHANLFGYSNSQ